MSEYMEKRNFVTSERTPEEDIQDAALDKLDAMLSGFDDSIRKYSEHVSDVDSSVNKARAEDERSDREYFGKAR